MGEEVEYATPEELCKIFRGLNRGSLANWRSARRGPKFHKLNRKIFYKISDVRRFLENGEVKTLDQRD